MQFDNTNRGSLFSNKDKKVKDTDPDFTGSINVNGAEFRLNGWRKTAKKTGQSFLSLSVRPKTEATKKPEFSRRN